MKIVTFFADADLPPKAQAKQVGFDWLWAVGELGRTGARFGYETLLVTDLKTDVRRDPWLRFGDTREAGLMLWLLDAQAAAIRQARAEGIDWIVMISPDTLLARPLDFLMDRRWDVAILTRDRPKPIVNSVLAVRPTAQTVALWERFCARANALSDESKTWGADIDALVDELQILPMENTMRQAAGCMVRFLPIRQRFRSINSGAPACRMTEPIWDFKGPRKARMAEYARML